MISFETYINLFVATFSSTLMHLVFSLILLNVLFTSFTGLDFILSFSMKLS